MPPTGAAAPLLTPPPAGLCGWGLSEHNPALWPLSGPLSPATPPEPTAHSPMTAVGCSGAPCSWAVTPPHCPHQHCGCGEETGHTREAEPGGQTRTSSELAAAAPRARVPSRQWVGAVRRPPRDGRRGCRSHHGQARTASGTHSPGARPPLLIFSEKTRGWRG